MIDRRKFLRHSRLSFTLVELLVVTAIIAVLAGAVLFAMWGVVEQAKEVRTRAQVAKLHTLISREWESYSTRVLRVTLPAGLPVMSEPFQDTNNSGKWEPGEPTNNINGNSGYDYGVARIRLELLRDLMRMTLPDRKSDLAVTPSPITAVPGPPAARRITVPLPNPSKWNSYRRKVSAITGSAPPWPAWTTPHQGAECLYLIVASIREGDSTGLDFFKEIEIGDTDGDGMREILDGWGRPIEFLRWAPGYATLPGPDGRWGVAGQDDDGSGVTDDYSERGWPGSDDVSDLQTRDGVASPDPFDPLKADKRATYRLIPLIFSGGPDLIYDIVTDDSPNPLIYRNRLTPSDPYTIINGGRQLGQPVDTGSDGEVNDQDNITNHLVETD